MCAHLGIVPKVRHADYLANWLAVLKADSRAIFHAASQASKASDFLLAIPQQAQAARLLLLDARATQVFVIQTQSAAVFCFGATRANRAGPIFAAGNAPRRANLAALWRFPCGL